MTVWVGLDLGTSGLKGVVVDEGGHVLARASHRYATRRPEPGAAEQDTAEWVLALDEVVAALRAAVDPFHWGGIGLSAMLPTLVTVDEHGAPTGPAISWEDGRAEAQGDALRERIGADELYRRTGQWVDGRYLVPMWQRIVETDPGRAARTARVLGAKDWIIEVLTGRALTDPSTAAGFGCYDLTTASWSDALGADLVPGLPDVVPASTTLPLTVTASLGSRLPDGMPLSIGAADSVLGALGMGVRDPGDVAYVAGTSTVVLGISDEREHDDQHRFLVTPTAFDGRWGLEMDLLSTGSAFRWLAGLVGADDEAALLRLAASADPAQAPLVLPYVGPGEQGALWDPDLVGSVIGLHVGHGAADLALGLVHGIVLESRRCVGVLDELGFDDHQPLRVAGGSASDPWFRQQLADATCRAVVAPVDGESDYSALGAAALAASAAGEHLPALVGETTRTEPDISRDGLWQGLAERLDEARGRIGHGVQER